MEVSRYSPRSPVSFMGRSRFSFSDLPVVTGSPPGYRPMFSPVVVAETAFGMSPQLFAHGLEKRPTSCGNRGNVILKTYNSSVEASLKKLQKMNLNESVESNVTDLTSCTSKSDIKPPNSRCTLPPWTMDAERREVIYTIGDVVNDHLVEAFAKDKIGCQFLQENFPKDKDLRDRLYDSIMQKPGAFMMLSRDVFANFFAQLLIENGSTREQRWVASELTNQMNEMCLNRYSCRVVQKALEVLDYELKCSLLAELRGADCVRLSIDQNANHVIQKIMDTFGVEHWAFIIENFLHDENGFFAVAESKYGCRVMQLAIETLTGGDQPVKKRLLMEVLHRVFENCERLAANEFSNYVVQHIICTPALAEYRERIIEDCLLRNLLSFSQEKFASHVVEKALTHAAPDLLKAMMEELFDGYVPDPETKKDCLDILLFHQYGNYVVQRMLLICLDARAKIASHHFIPDSSLYLKWSVRLENLITTNSNRLRRYSSGKKILETLYKHRAEHPRIPSSTNGYNY